jgi:hypothetical protein
MPPEECGRAPSLDGNSIHAMCWPRGPPTAPREIMRGFCRAAVYARWHRDELGRFGGTTTCARAKVSRSARRLKASRSGVTRTIDKIKLWTSLILALLVVVTLLILLAPDSDAETLLGTVVVATVITAGIVIRLNRQAEARQHTQPWICPACRAGNHKRCKGALLFVREGPQPCQCKDCVLNR